MGLEKIGLEGVFKTEAFARGLSQYTSGIAGALSKTLSAGGPIKAALGGIVTTGVTAFVALGAAAITAGGIVAGVMTKMIFNAAALGDSFSAMSGVTGISVTRLQELAYAGKLLDVELEVMTSGLRFLTRNMWTAKDGTGDAADAFRALGIRVKDSTGKLRDADIVFGEVIDKLGKMTNETERDAIAMKIMGRSAMELNPLIKAGSAALAQYSAEAHTMGAVISEEGIVALDLFQDQLDALKLSFKGLSAMIALTFLPSFANIQDGVRSFVTELNTIFSTSGGNWQVMADGVKRIVVRILKNLTKSIPKVTKTIKAMIKSITKIITQNAPHLISAGGELLAAILAGIAENIPELVASGLLVMRTLYDAVVKALPSILAAGGEIVRAIGQGIRDGLANLPSFSEIVNWIFKTAVDLTQRFKDWFGKVKWDEIGNSIIAGLQSIKWEEKGKQLSLVVKNVADGLGDAIKVFPWGKTGAELSASFADFWVGFFTGFTEPEVVIDPRFKEDIRPDPTWQNRVMAVWKKNIDQMTQDISKYGATAWRKEFGNILGQAITDTWKLLLDQRMLPGMKTIGETFDVSFEEIRKKFEDAIDSWVYVLETLPSIINIWMQSVAIPYWRTVGERFVSAIQSGIASKWDAFVTWYLGKLAELIARINKLAPWLFKLEIIPTLPTTPKGGKDDGGGGKNIIPPQNIPQSTPILSPLGYTGMGGGRRSTSTKTVNNNITVNNPTAEPASTSVDRTLRKLSYLGVTG